MSEIGVVVLGSTGTVGCNTLDVLALHRERFRVVALAARSNVELMLLQCRRFEPEWAAMQSEAAAQALEQQLRQVGCRTRVLAGAAAIAQLATQSEVDYVMAAISGAAGLASALAAAGAGKRLLLANKESAVMAGALLISAVQRSGAQLIPIDSEHNAIFQCLPAGFQAGTAPRGVRRLILTASGGPFLNWSAEAAARATPAQACAHPRWNMGRKISVDSATLMNKGLELIEASVLFGMPRTRSISSCTRKAWCTRWWSTRTARCWRSCRRRTCACRLPRRWRGRIAWRPAWSSWIWCGRRGWIFWRPIRSASPACATHRKPLGSAASVVPV
jgi:1-deoxy-D-xylulose-5-phosphate reductoisomerase